MSRLNANSTVAEWVCEHPQTARVFEDLRIDYCCGGSIALADACAEKQLDAEEVVAQLTGSVDAPTPESTEDWAEAGLANLCQHIQSTHHTYLREEFPRLVQIIDKVVAAHGESHPELKELQKVIALMRAELELHMHKEEEILFPAIQQMEQAANLPSFPFGTVANPIRMMEHEHDAAGEALARIRELTNDFQPPADACSTYREMLDSLLNLERDMHQHVHKENNILFPKAEKLEASLSP